VFDLGGGSTEIVSGLGEQPGRWASLRMGAVTLTEKYIRSNPPSDKEMEELQSHVDRELMHHCALMPVRTPILAGVGGTVTVMASLDRGLEAYDPALLEGWTIETPRLEALIQRVARAPEDERKQWTVMGAGRSDIIVAGVLVVSRIAARFPSRGLVCSTQGLRFGLARLALGELRESLKPPAGPADLSR
jgi:exopolyphosphatase/guanosine-5'-triphosphate,3'-diphosphate pyrophosphatase